MISYLYWDPQAELFSIPFLNFPILWYGVFFALGFWLGFLLFVRILLRYFLKTWHGHTAAYLEEKAQKIADRLTVYLVIATVVGARLAHFFFYESPAQYLADPWEIFLIRKGGLASHGAALGIVIAAILFCRRYRKELPGVTWIRLLDFLSPPAALAGAFIRIGNFFNQEILGTVSQLPWAVVFGHPADGSFPAPRHPVQLYEAIGYLAIFILLWRLSLRPRVLMAQGKLIGLFLILVFSLRFLIEFLKLEQSPLLTHSYLTMGQILSLPAIALGLWFYLDRLGKSRDNEARF